MDNDLNGVPELLEDAVFAHILWQNTYTNGVSDVEPFLDAYTSPVHFIR